VLENSSVSSFYANSQKSNLPKELKLAVDNNLIADFRIRSPVFFVLGLVLLVTCQEEKASYRDLKLCYWQFWKIH
jgi:hypothetical protein